MCDGVVDVKRCMPVVPNRDGFVILCRTQFQVINTSKIVIIYCSSANIFYVEIICNKYVEVHTECVEGTGNSILAMHI